jgi:acyl carrier protein
MSKTEGRLVQCFAAVFPGKTTEQILTANPDTFAEWDSVTAITLLTVIQEEFGIEMEPEDFAEMISFQGILGYLDKQSSSPD